MPRLYGVPTDASGAELLPWTWAVEQLTSTRSYWVCTTRPDGRPHAAPVWGVWLDDAVWFSTAPSSVKGRNIARDPRVVVHLESGDETVILEGEAKLPTDDAALLEAQCRIADVDAKSARSFLSRLKKEDSCFLLHLSEGVSGPTQVDSMARRHFLALQVAPD